MNRLVFPPLHEILHFEADVNYTIIHMISGKKEMTSYTLKRYADMPELADFKRINRKYLVNPSVIKEIRKEHKRQIVVLRSGLELKVSRRKKNMY